MSHKFEIQLRELLIEMQDVSLVADHLMKIWDRGDLDPSEEEIVATFLLNSGLYPSLISRVQSQVSKKKKVLWGHFGEAISICWSQLSKKYADAIVEGAKEQGLINNLLGSHGFDQLHPEISVLRENFLREQIGDREIKRQELLERIQFLASQRLIDEEKKTLEKYKKLFPEDREIAKYVQEFEERWARQLIAARSEEKISERITFKHREEMRAEFGQLVHCLFNSSRNFVQKDASLAYDLAVMFYFMEFYPEALKIVEFCEDSPEKDWFRLELLLLNRRYIDALEDAKRLELKHSVDPEASFASSFAKAKAYWGLEQKVIAIDLLTSIINVRPNYRSASSLLQQWQGGHL